MISHRQADLINTFIGPAEVYIYVKIPVKDRQQNYPNQSRNNLVLEQQADIAIMVKPNNEKVARFIANSLEIDWRTTFKSHGVEYIHFPYTFNLRSHTTVDENSFKSILLNTINVINQKFKVNCDYKYYEKTAPIRHILATIKFEFRMVDVEGKL
jgi:hypothetical protein